MKVKVSFKDPDLIFDIINARHPLPDDEQEITPRMESQREEFREKYFEYGDYGCIEIDTESLTGTLLERTKWE